MIFFSNSRRNAEKLNDNMGEFDFSQLPKGLPKKKIEKIHAFYLNRQRQYLQAKKLQGPLEGLTKMSAIIGFVLILIGTGCIIFGIAEKNSKFLIGGSVAAGVGVFFGIISISLLIYVYNKSKEIKLLELATKPKPRRRLNNKLKMNKKPPRQQPSEDREDENYF
jgi:hypothetical protein